MCGIVGFIGCKPAAPLLLEGLAKLEYRGYDSAGIALVSAAGMEIIKPKDGFRCCPRRLTRGKR